MKAQQQRQSSLKTGAAIGIAVACLALLAMAGGAALGESQAERDDEAGPGSARLESPTRSGAGSISGRLVDPANRVSSLHGPVNRDNFPELDLGDPFGGNYEQVQELFGWKPGYVDDSEFGRAIADCRIKYQRAAYSGNSCHMRQRIYVAQEGGEFVAVEVESYHEDLEADRSEACEAWTACNRDAWLGRSAPQLSGAAMIDAGQFFPKFSDLTPDTSDAELLEMYKDALAEAVAANEERWAYIQEQERLGSWSSARRNSLYSTYNTGTGREADYRIMIERLNDGV